MKRALVLCSGGLDSVVSAYHAKHVGYSVTLVFFDYGQVSLKAELRAVKYCARQLNAPFIIRKLPRALFAGSPLHQNKTLSVVHRSDLKNTQRLSKEWYVPCRNLIFLSHALSLAEHAFVNDKVVYDIIVGFIEQGNDGYPDTSATFVKEMNRIAATSCAHPFKIYAPLIEKDKEDVVTLGVRLGVALDKTVSCYRYQKKHCGVCLACALRKEGFYWAGISDKTAYIS